MAPIPRPQAAMGAYGYLTTDARSYQPLDIVTVRIKGRTAGDRHGRIWVCDPDQKPYFEADVDLVDNQVTVSFHAAGALGTHYIYLKWPDETGHHNRYINFRLECHTFIASGDPDFDSLYPFTRDAMLLGRREYRTPRGRFVGYISGDTWHFDGIWLRDWIYGMAAFKYWERDLICGIDRFLENQSSEGMVPDGIERDGGTWRVGLESDVEYIMVFAVWQAWQVTGDDDWLRNVLPRLEKALAYIQTDPRHWDAQRQLVQRQHSCDTWDYDIDGASASGESRHVIATCDQSGYGLAFELMGRMHRCLGNQVQADHWQRQAETYRQRANRLLWDGSKFRHHVHLDPIDHGDFDESRQLAMGNTWAMTRGLATPEQAVSVIDEYCRRHEETADAYPWWSLQPGYPDHLNYFAEPFTRQGGYANGGLMPWVGGELCRAAFFHGRERYGIHLLRQYADHLRRTGSVHVWYWPNGEAGFRTTNEVPYAGWGMAEWVNALIEGLAGIRDVNGQMKHVHVSPRWPAAGINRVSAATRYAASDFYFAYQFHLDPSNGSIGIMYCGSGERVDFHVLLPERWEVRSIGSMGVDINFEHQRLGQSRYVNFSAAIQGVGKIIIQCHRDCIPSLPSSAVQ